MYSIYMYSRVPNRSPCAFISGKVCLLTLIEPKRQTLPEISVYTCLFGSIEYMSVKLSFCQKDPPSENYLGKRTA